MTRLLLWCLLGIGVWFCHADVSGQDAPKLPGPVEAKNETIVRKAPLDLIILYDTENNRSLKLPGGWPLAELDGLYRTLMSDQQDKVPPFIIRNVSATGSVVGNHVEANVQIELATSGNQTVQIPLGFKEGIFPSEDQTDVPTFSYTGSGSASLTSLMIDSQERQYVALVTPHVAQASESEKSDSPETPLSDRHTISLLLWIPLVPNSGGEKRLSLSFPQSNSSRFLLEIPMTNIDASATRGFLLEPQEDAERRTTLLTVQGLRTGTEIAWKRREIAVVDDQPELLVERGTIDVKLDADAQSAIYDAVLPVSSATGSFDQLQIQLPQGSVLDRETTERYAVAGNYVVEDVSDQAVLTIRFSQKTAGPVSIHLRATQQFEGDVSDFRQDLSGFEVLGAERQTGSLTVSVSPSDMQPRWEPVRGIRRAEGGNSSSPSIGGTRFDFNSQPFRLRVQVAAPQIRINVKPDYYFHISRGGITLTARLAYTVSGSKTGALYLRLPDSQWDWEFDTSGIVDASGVALDEFGDLKIPLRTPQEGAFNIEFRAHRTIEAEDEQRHRLVLPIPRPERVNWRESAEVTIVSAYDIEVLPVVQDTRGLTRQTTRRPTLQRIDTTDTQQEALYYRAELPDAVFVTDLVFHQQKISAVMQTDVRLFDENPQVSQTISYNAAYGPADRVLLLLPKALDASGIVQVQWKGRTLELRDTIAAPQENGSDNWVRKMVHIPESAFQFQLTFLYAPPPIVVAADDTVPFSFPFICPVDVPVTDHLIHFFTPTGYRVLLQSESKLQWEPFREMRLPAVSVTESFRSVQSPNVQTPTRIVLFVSATEQSVSGTTIVERAWLQTWLTGAIRRDRATYLVRSTNDSVELQLPPDSMRDHRVSVQVEHQSIRPNISPTGLLAIPILPEYHNRPIEISVDYRYAFEMTAVEVPITLPSFAGDTLVQYKFWQVILPQSRHIIGSPAGWTLVYDWSWNGWFWWRVPSIRKSDIGFVSDLTTPDAVVSGGSQYVFSHLQPTSRVRLYVVKRSQVILWSSGIALFIGLVLIYVPQSRYVGSLFGLGVALLAVLFYQPPLVLLMLQASTFGVFLALGAGYIYRIFHRQRQWIPPTFPMMEDLSQSYPTPLPSQTLHEVVIDDSSSNEPSVINHQ